MTIKEALNTGTIMLKMENINSPKLKARITLQYILKQTREYLIVYDKQEITKEDEAKYIEAIKRIVNGEPLQHITQTQEFMKLNFFVNNKVLIPRQDTEILVEEVLKISQNIDNPIILDLCTGSGAIGVSIAKYLNDCTIYSTDISEEALHIAKKNAKANGVQGKMKFIQSNLFENLKNLEFDIIVSNPPYIKSSDIIKLDKEVQKEPKIALDGGKDGLDFYRKITKQAYKYLKPQGFLCYEIGYDEKKDVIDIIDKTEKYKDTYCIKDLYGNDRVIITRKERGNVMSFSSEVKEELSEIANLYDKESVKDELLGYLISGNTFFIKNSKIKYSTENEYNINRFTKLLKNVKIENYQIDIQGKVYTVVFNNKEIKDNCLLQKDKLNIKEIKNLNAFVRGIFLGAGSVNNPENEYHLSLEIKNIENLKKIKQELDEIGIFFKEFENTLYIKDGDDIFNFLAFIGATKSVLKFEDIRVKREMNNRINRIVNCKTANLNKTINASIEAIEAIKKLKELHKFEMLDDSLKEISEIRIKYPDISLIELGKKLKKPLGKSGVNYRLKKIIEIANNY